MSSPGRSTTGRSWRPGRFEWKILGAMMLVAVLAVGTAAFGLHFALRGLSDFARDRQRAIVAASARVLASFHEHFEGRKADFRARTQTMAAQRPRGLADLRFDESVVQARLRRGDQVVETWTADVERMAALRAAPAVSVPLPGSGEPPRVLEVTFGIPSALLENFDQLRAATQREQELDRVFDLFAPRFFAGYFLFVLGVLAVTPIIGLWLARRVTSRVQALRDAAVRVGEGDLSVRLDPAGKDEIAELGRAFDRMVGELRETRSRVEYLQKVSAWQEVARRLAHEIKNPLTPIQLSVQELVTKYRGDDPQFRALLATTREILREEIETMRRMLDNFSAFAKLPEPELVPVDVAALIQEIVRLQPEWHDFVEVDTRGGAAPALADRTLLRRVVANLVENGVQAAGRAGRLPRVRISVRPKHGRRRAVIFVDDNGPGVPPGDRERIFDPYVTHREGGTGLGLAIVRKIVLDHGGDVWVAPERSSLGGARLVIELPESLTAISLPVRA